jgi:hypothetical protein
VRRNGVRGSLYREDAGAARRRVVRATPDLLELDRKTLETLRRGLAKSSVPVTPFWLGTPVKRDQPT